MGQGQGAYLSTVLAIRIVVVEQAVVVVVVAMSSRRFTAKACPDVVFAGCKDVTCEWRVVKAVHLTNSQIAPPKSRTRKMCCHEGWDRARH